MNPKIIACGLSDEQAGHLEAAVPDGYEVAAAQCVTDLTAPTF